VVWVLTGEGIAHGPRDGPRFTHAFGAPADKGNGSGRRYAPTLGVEVPGRGTWFWSRVQYDIVNECGDGERIIAGFHVFRDGQSEERPAWSVAIAAASVHLAPDGTIWLVAAEVPGRLPHFDGQTWSETSPEGSSVRPQDLDYLTTDTRGRVWLIDRDGTKQTAVLENGRWRTFSPREIAYSTIALEEKGHADFRLGTPGDPRYPAFAGDGRVAYLNEWSRICFFDGNATWDYA